jgi:hypothetical protein
MTVENLNAEFGANGILVSATGSEPGPRFVVHNKQITPVEMTVHLLYLIFIYNV